MQVQEEEVTHSYYSLSNIGNTIMSGWGAVVGAIYYPLTLPFIEAATKMHAIHTENAELWREHRPKSSKESPFNYAYAAVLIAGNTIMNLITLQGMFLYNIFLAVKEGVVQGYERGALRVLTAPASQINQYRTDGEKFQGSVYFRSKHLLSFALTFSFLLSVVIATISPFLPVFLMPMSLLANITGIHLSAVLGVSAVSVLTPFLNFLSTMMLAVPAVMSIEGLVFGLIYLGQGFSQFIQKLLETPSSSNQYARLQYGLKTGVSLLDKLVAIAVGLPLYIFFKPSYQALDSVRSIFKSNKAIWSDGKTAAEKKNTFIQEWLYKSGLSLLMLGNTVGRIFFVPIQVFMSILYAPFQGFRHATKYGTPHVLKFPHQYANNYRGEFRDKKNNKYDGDGKHYDNIRLSKYQNVYYFRLKHVAILSVLVGLSLVVLSSIMPTFGYISVNLTINALTPLGLAKINLSGITVSLVSFLTGAIATSAIAASIYVASYLLWKLSVGLSSLVGFLSKTSHFHHVSHKYVSAGEALRVLKKENLTVKTIASKVKPRSEGELSPEEKQEEKFGASWLFNLEQFKNPAGINLSQSSKRPVYLENDPKRQYARHKTYSRWDPKTGEMETKKMGGERGRPKIWAWILSIITLGFIPAYTKKTSVSLAPKDGMAAFFGGREDAVGLAFDLNKLNTKNEKYVFVKDAWTNLKWWWKWLYKKEGVKDHVRRSVTVQQLRNLNRTCRYQNEVPEHTEILACLTLDALMAVVVSSSDLSYRLNALLRKLIIKYELGIDLPILIMGTLNKVGISGTYHADPLPPEEYTIEQQVQDLFQLSRAGWLHDGKPIFDAMAQHYSPSKENTDEAKKSFVKTLVNSHPINWATVFHKLEKPLHAEFKNYIQEASGIDLNMTVDYKRLPTHLSG